MQIPQIGDKISMRIRDLELSSYSYKESVVEDTIKKVTATQVVTEKGHRLFWTIGNSGDVCFRQYSRKPLPCINNISIIMRGK